MYRINDFDLLIKDLLKGTEFFPQSTLTPNYPYNIYQDNDSGDLIFDIACTGVKKEDITVEIEGSTLRVAYTKTKENDSIEYVVRKIANRSFDLSWKVSTRFELSEAVCKYVNGLLTIRIPIKETEKPVKLSIL